MSLSFYSISKKKKSITHKHISIYSKYAYFDSYIKLNFVPTSTNESQIISQIIFESLPYLICHIASAIHLQKKNPRYSYALLLPRESKICTTIGVDVGGKKNKANGDILNFLHLRGKNSDKNTNIKLYR